MTAIRHLLWLTGAPARALLIGIIRTYRASLSGWLGGQCRFAPSCSQFAEDAIRLHGAVKGSALATWRVLRCNPYGKGGLDPVPPRVEPAAHLGGMREMASYTTSESGPGRVET